MKARFLKSAEYPKDFPNLGLPEVVVVGRSNAGKSSFINAYTGQKIAKTSQLPGKTRLVNFFSIDEAFVLVDVPGYGYAKRPKKEVMAWQQYIESYLVNSSNLLACLLIMDCRRLWQDEEQQILDWALRAQKRGLILLNKKDKCNQREISRITQYFKSQNLPWQFQFLSCSKGQGLEEVNQYIFQEWVGEKAFWD